MSFAQYSYAERDLRSHMPRAATTLNDGFNFYIANDDWVDLFRFTILCNEFQDQIPVEPGSVP
jgi:hypothetical protein